MSKPDQTITKTAASTDLTTFTKVQHSAPTDAPACRSDGHQVCRVGGSLNNSAGTATVRFVLRSASRVYKVIDVAFTASTARTTPAGGAGDYVASVAATTNDWVDLYGASAGAENANDPVAWYVGLSALATATSVTIDLYFSRAM